MHSQNPNTLTKVEQCACPIECSKSEPHVDMNGLVQKGVQMIHGKGVQKLREKISLAKKKNTTKIGNGARRLSERRLTN